MLMGVRGMSWSFKSQTGLHIRLQVPLSLERREACTYINFQIKQIFHACVYFDHMVQKGWWELINLGEGNSELASFPPGTPIRDIGVTHQIEYP